MKRLRWFWLKLQEIKGRFSITVPKSFVQLLAGGKGTQVVVYPHPEKKRALIIEEMPKK